LFIDALLLYLTPLYQLAILIGNAGSLAEAQPCTTVAFVHPAAFEAFVNIPVAIDCCTVEFLFFGLWWLLLVAGCG
jgi:hypothetical protein